MPRKSATDVVREEKEKTDELHMLADASMNLLLEPLLISFFTFKGRGKGADALRFEICISFDLIDVHACIMDK